MWSKAFPKLCSECPQLLLRCEEIAVHLLHLRVLPLGLEGKSKIVWGHQSSAMSLQMLFLDLVMAFQRDVGRSPVFLFIVCLATLVCGQKKSGLFFLSWEEREGSHFTVNRLSTARAG